MDVPRELVELIARGDVVLFVGSGLSIGAGLPSWNELLTLLADSIGLPNTLRTDPLKVAQHYENKRGRQALVSHIIEQTGKANKKPTDNHRRLARLGIRTWATTNYDDLLEQTLREVGERCDVVVRNQDLSYVSNEAVTLVKLHGDYQQPDTIVITQQDYDTYSRRFPRVKDKLTGLLLDKTFFFVGYSINDPDFNRIQAEIAYDLQQHQRMAYAVLFDADEFTLSDLKSRNVHILNIPMGGQTNYSERLGELLDDLINQVDQTCQRKVQEARPVVTIPAPLEAEDVRGLLGAMGYRITDTQAAGADLYFLCDAKWGAEIRQEVVHFVGREPTPGAIAALNDAVTSHDAARGTLLTRQPLSATLRDLVHQRELVQCYTLDEFTERLADFRPYLEHLIQEHESSEIPAFYVPLTVKNEADGGKLESFVDNWLTEPDRNHLSILGDFGSGKTWFCQRCAYLATKRYLVDPAHNRIPILITLRNYSRAYDVEQLITDAIVNRYKVGLAAGYKTFARLNEAGRLLLIFDGFDEMERRVSDYRTTVDNFWELAEVVLPASKVILTCRTAYFRHWSEEKKTLTPRRSQISMAAGDQVIDLRGHQQFEVVHLLNFDDEDIKLALQKRLPTRWNPVYQKTQELTNLRDLASRPVLLDMIVKTLPEIQDASQINQATLYEAYVDTLLRRRWSEDTDFIPPQGRLFFIQELAWKMYQTQKLTIPFSEFPEQVTTHFGLKDDPERAAFFERDVRTQSYLVRDDAGNYRFAHKSFMEYFIARKMTDAISGSDFEVEKVIGAWKTQPLTPEIRDFLLHMITDPALLWQLIKVTQGKTTLDVGYSGGNAATLLRVKGGSFANTELARTVLAGADLFNVNLTGADLRNACLREANLSGATLKGANLRGAILESSHFSEVMEIRSVDYSPFGQYIVAACDDGNVRIWSIRGAEATTLSREHLAYVRSVCYRPPMGEQIASSSTDGSVIIWDVNSKNPIAKFEQLYGSVHRLAFDPSGQVLAFGSGHGIIELRKAPNWTREAVLDGHRSYVSTVCFSPNGKLLSSGGYDGIIAVWDIAAKKKLRSLHFGGVLNEVAFSPDGCSLASCGDDQLVKIWEVETGTLLVELKHQDWVYGIAYDPDGTLLATGDTLGVVTIWNTRFNKLVGKWQAHKSVVRSLVYSPDGDQLASGGMDGTVRIWDVDHNSPDFKKCLKELTVEMNCLGARIGGAEGLDAPAPDGKGTLRDWLIARGAVE